MGKPINIKTKNQLPVLKTREIKKLFENLGFNQTKENHKHIKFRKGEIEQILIKGNKDIHPNLLNKIINELSEKLDIPKSEIIKKIMKKK